MYQSVEAHSRLSHVFKTKFFARIVNVFKLMLLSIFVKVTIVDVCRALIQPLACSDAGS